MKSTCLVLLLLFLGALLVACGKKAPRCWSDDQGVNHCVACTYKGGCTAFYGGCVPEFCRELLSPDDCAGADLLKSHVGTTCQELGYTEWCSASACAACRAFWMRPGDTCHSCGDGKCDTTSGESCQLCPEDCGACP